MSSSESTKRYVDKMKAEGRWDQKQKNAQIREIYIKSFSDPEKRLRRMLSNVKANAKNRGIEFNIVFEDVKWNTTCPVFGIPLVSEYGRGMGFHPDSPSMDRIDNSKGYLPGNIRIISAKANVCKNQMTKEECEMLLKNWDAV